MAAGEEKQGEPLGNVQNLPLFPPPLCEQISGMESPTESMPIGNLELSEVELTTEPVVAFYHIRVRNADGFAWTVMKRYAELVGFFDAMRPVTGLPSLPWNKDEVSLAQDYDSHTMVQEQLDALLACQGAVSQRIFQDFFHVGEEYQRRDKRRPSADSANPQHAKRAEKLVEDVHREIREQHAWEREQMEQYSASKDMTQSCAWRRQEVYRSNDLGDRMRHASLRHLMRHSDWLGGSGRLPDAVLRGIVAMQHYVERDLQDLRMPEASRCYRDTFEGGCISRQLLLDAARSTYHVDGRKFNFPMLFEEHGRPADEEPILKKCFTESLVSAIQESIGRGVAPPPLLACAITSTMSQAGLANLDLACGDLHIAVSGGEHRVQFSLQARADGAWDVTISTHKVGFESFIVCSARDMPQTDARSRSCSSRSSILKLCTIRFIVQIGSGEVGADVLNLQSELHVVDRWGRSLLGEARCSASCLAGLCAKGQLAPSVGAAARRICSRGKWFSSA